MDTNVIYNIYLFIIIPLLLTLLFGDKKSKMIFGFLIIGVTICLIASELNNIIMTVFNYDFFYYSVTISPIIEEILKSIALIFTIFVIFDNNEINTCISLGLAIGIGFAMFENIIIYFQSGSEESLWWAVVRGIGAGLMHGICGGAMGFGLCFIKNFGKNHFLGVLSIMSAIIIYHGFYNLLIQTEQFKMVGLMLPSVTCLAFVPINYHYMKTQKIN